MSGTIRNLAGRVLPKTSQLLNKVSKKTATQQILFQFACYSKPRIPKVKHNQIEFRIAMLIAERARDYCSLLLVYILIYRIQFDCVHT